MGSVGPKVSAVLGSDKLPDEIKKNPKITANQLVSMLDITWQAIEKHAH